MFNCETYGYKLVTREQFLSATDRPEFLLERAQGNDPRGEFGNQEDLTHYTFVVYDPDDDYEGWMLWGDDPNVLDTETMEMIHG